MTLCDIIQKSKSQSFSALHATCPIWFYNTEKWFSREIQTKTCQFHGCWCKRVNLWCVVAGQWAQYSSNMTDPGHYRTWLQCACNQADTSIVWARLHVSSESCTKTSTENVNLIKKGAIEQAITRKALNRQHIYDKVPNFRPFDRSGWVMHGCSQSTCQTL